MHLLLHPRYEESMGRKKVLEDELNDLQGKLQRAEKLVTGELSEQRVSPSHGHANITPL